MVLLLCKCGDYLEISWATRVGIFGSKSQKKSKNATSMSTSPPPHKPTHQHEFHILKDRESVGIEVAEELLKL